MASDAQGSAKEAILKAAEAIAEAGVEYGGPSGAAMIRDAAYAWRAAVGGSQPGGIVVQNNNN